MTSDTEFDFLPAAGQMKLTEIQKAQIKRVRDKAMEELNSVLARVRLTVDEYTTAENELETSESPDPEYEAEEEERKMRERKRKRKERKAQRKMDLQEEEGEEEGKIHSMEREALVQTTTSGIQEKGGEEGASSESDEDSSGSSTEEDKDKDKKDAEEKETKQETWAMPGQVQRKISQKTLVRVSEKIRIVYRILDKHFQSLEIYKIGSRTSLPVCLFKK